MKIGNWFWSNERITWTVSFVRGDTFSWTGKNRDYLGSTCGTFSY